MSWLNGLLLLVLVAGQAGLVVTLVNRLHALPLGCPTLRVVRRLHDVLMFALPIALVGLVGLSGPALLMGGQWSKLSPGWMVYLGLCGLGAVGMAASGLRHCLRSAPQVQVSNHSWTLDIEQRLGYRPVGGGPYRMLTRLPGNQVFQVQVSDKTYRLPRLPVEWDGLSILHLTDLHFIGTLDRPYFEEICRCGHDMAADMVVFTGDLLDNEELIEWLPETLGRLTAPLGCYFVLGNHDWYLDPHAIRRRLEALGWQDAASRCLAREHRGRMLAIGGSEVPWMGQHPDFRTAPDDAFRILLSHTPDNLRWARQQRVDLMLSGHNHGGQIVPPMLGPLYSPSVYGCRYAAGAFWHAPTLLYVSRGIAGRHALRWNCPPELTRLVLESRSAESGGRRAGEGAGDTAIQ